MELLFSGRCIKQETEAYLPLHTQNLLPSYECIDGNGSPEFPYRVQVRIKNQGRNPWLGVIQIEYPMEINTPAFYLPGFMYGTNRGDCPIRVDCEYPRIRAAADRRPASSWWMVRGDRLSMPLALIYDSGRVRGISGSPYWIIKDNRKSAWKKDTGDFFQYAGYTIHANCDNGQGRGSVGYTLGYENAPWLFIQSHQIREREPLDANCFQIEKGETVEFELTLFDYPADNETGIYSAMKVIYREYHEEPRKIGSVNEAVSDLSEAISSSAWLEAEQMYSGFVWKREDGTYKYNPLGSLSWTNGLAVAVPMLMAGIRLNNPDIREKAILAIENILDKCMNTQSGLPYDAVTNGKWSINGWWFDGMHTPGHSAYIVGQAVYYILKALYYEKEKMDCQHEGWLSFVQPIIEKMEQEKNTEQEYPFIFSEKTGAGLEYDSFGGAWCLAAGALYAKLTKDNRYLAGLKESEAHYYEKYVKHAICYGTPLDTDKAVDSEGILAYIRAVCCLHQISGEKYYLEHMKDALDYEFSFKFCYNSPVQVPPLSHIGWSSCGGSITSTANPHIHPMSSTIVDEMLYYVKQTGDSYVQSRMRDTVLWGCQTYNTYDGEYGYGEKGWMSERFCYSQGLVCEKYPDGSPASTWFALMPWAGSSVVEGLAGDLWETMKDKSK